MWQFLALRLRQVDRRNKAAKCEYAEGQERILKSARAGLRQDHIAEIVERTRIPNRFRDAGFGQEAHDLIEQFATRTARGDLSCGERVEMERNTQDRRGKFCQFPGYELPTLFR